MPEARDISAAVDRENPWPGLASFTEDSRAFFFGREKETEELVRLIKRNTLTVLFGQSGLGKSSLLQAGAFPVLREADYLPLYLRLDHSTGAAAPSPRSSESAEPAAGAPRLHQTATLADQVKAALVEAVKSAGAEAPAPRADETLWEYFHRKDVDIWSAKNRLLTPVLAFDQFEEIFTLGRASEAQRERGRAFLTELADLVENRAPAALRAKFDAGELDLTRYNFDKPSCQVVLSLREDFLPDLEGLKHEMRSILHSRMRVKRLNGAQALEIVTRPAPHLIADGVAERIVEFVAGARGGSTERLAELEVEPALLSVICRELNERRRTLRQTQITADLVSGNRREILTDFYERSVADLPEDMRAFVEDHLLTKSGFRDNLALETALEFPGVTRPLLDTLVSRRLLRIEDRLGVQRVELTHDVLAEVIRASRDTRQQRLATEQLHQRERITRRRMWLARIIAAGLLVAGTGVSWIAWRAIRAEREQARLRREAEAQELAALRKAYASDMNGVQAALAVDNLRRARELLDRHRPAPGEIDLRGWEWRYLWQFCRSDSKSVLRKPDDVSIYSLSTSSDGKWIAAGTRRGQLLIINLETREEIKIPAGDVNVRVAFSPRQPLIAVAMRLPLSQGGGSGQSRLRVFLWDLTSRREVWTQSRDGIGGLFFSDDGQSLVVGGSTSAGEREIALLRVADGSKVAAWEGGSMPTSTTTASTHFAVSRDLSSAATVYPGGQLRVIDLKTGRERWRATATNDGVRALAFSADGRILASGAGFVDSTIRLWDASDGRPLGQLEGQRGWTSGLVFLADGKHLVSSCGDQTLRLWNLETRTAVRAFRGHDAEVYALALLNDQRTVVSGGKDGSLQVWDLTAERGASASGSFSEGRGTSAFYGENSDSILSLSESGRISRRHGRSYELRDLLLETGSVVRSSQAGRVHAVFDRKRPLVALESETNKLQVWDWERRLLVREWSESAESRLGAPRYFSAGGTRIVTIHGAQSATLSFREWDIATGKVANSFELVDVPAAGLGGVTVSPDETHVLLHSSVSGQVARVDLPSGRMTPLKLDLVEPSFYGPGFSPDRRLLVWTSFYGYARVFDASSYKTVTTLSGFMLGVHSAGFSADGERLAIGSTANEAMTIWDARSYERLLTLPAYTSSLSGTSFSPNGNVLAGRSSFGGSVHFWRAPSWAEIEKAEAEAASATSARPAP